MARPNGLFAVPNATAGDWSSSPTLTRWVNAGLVTNVQAQAIADYETSQDPESDLGLLLEQTREGEAPLAEASGRPEGHATIPIALGYVGAALAIVAGLSFSEMITGWKGVVILALLAVLLAAAGAGLVRNEQTAVSRLGDFTWLLSVGSTALATSLLLGPVLLWADVHAALATSVASLTVASALWWAHGRAVSRRSALQQLATYAALIATIMSLLALAGAETSRDVSPQAIGLTLWGLGAVWALLSANGLVQPAGTGVVLGIITVYVGSTVTSIFSSWWLTLGVVSTALVFAASTRTGSPLLTGLGVLGVLVFTPQILWIWAGDSHLLLPLAFMVMGLTLLAVAVIWNRRTRARAKETGPTEANGAAPRRSVG